MKRICISFFIVAIIILSVIGLNLQKTQPNEEYLRIHIRAESNLKEDQAVKYLVKDEIVNYVMPYLVNCGTKRDSVNVITALIDDIEDVCDATLCKNGFTYKSRARIDEEYFPTRAYDNITLEAGLYDALIIELGEGVGDNWWCIVYPPLCFVNKNDLSEHNIQYQSYLVEIIRKYFKR